MLPIEGQNVIFLKIKEEKKQIDAMLQIIDKTIERLSEYRTALITAAVTGKIDVSSLDVPDEEAA